MDSTSSKALERLVEAPPYSLPQAEKAALLTDELRALTDFHRAQCGPYARILAGLQSPPIETLDQVPFIPVRLFKTLKLQSIPDDQVLKVLTSSGTTSQQVSRIILDRGTSLLQTKALASIITSFIGPKRLPMIIIDSASVLKNKDMSARGAGLVGLSNFGRDHLYGLDDEMRPNLPALHDFLARHAGQPILLFGFTYMVWQYFYEPLRAANQKLHLSNGILIHSGGWKKLQDQAVTNDVFKDSIREQTGIQRIHNFYGMVEQVGGVYMECEVGSFHAPNMAEIIIRDPRDWSALPAGAPGLVQTLSVLPRSYPGHSLLTEDLGVIEGWDNCPCGRKGVRFKIHGRMPRAELRGCSDTHAFSKSPATAGLRQFLPETKSAASIEELCPSEFFSQNPLPAFDPLTIEFLDHVSAEIQKLPQAKNLPELSALAFWLRKASLSAFKTNDFIQPLGLVFHVAPSNVDTIFVYSWALSLLAGNLNIVRISQTVPPQLDLLLQTLSHVLAQARFGPIRARNIILTYPHDQHISQFLSSHADARLIWGGDATVARLRSFEAKPTTREISFADKVSFCVISSARYFEKPLQPRAFYNDAYQFDQLACSSPHFVIFTGSAEDCARASAQFWSALTDELKSRGHADQPSNRMDRLVAAAEAFASDPAAQQTHGRQSPSPVVIRIPLTSIPTSRARPGGGYFIESFSPDLAQLATVLQSGDQTLAYYGYTADEMRQAARALTLRGIDRIVPVGQALNFTPIWDGYVLLNELTRRIVIA